MTTGRDLQVNDFAETDYNGEGSCTVVKIVERDDTRNHGHSQSGVLFRVYPLLKGGNVNSWYCADWFRPYTGECPEARMLPRRKREGKLVATLLCLLENKRLFSDIHIYNDLFPGISKEAEEQPEKALASLINNSDCGLSTFAINRLLYSSHKIQQAKIDKIYRLCTPDKQELFSSAVKKRNAIDNISSRV